MYIKLLKTAVLISAFVPSIAVPNSNVSKDVSKAEISKADKKQIDCLAANVFYEARSESKSGQELVALVTLNRVKDKSHPNDVCSVVTEKRKKKGRSICQFSWYCERGKDKKLHNNFLNKEKPENYEQIYYLSRKIYLNYEYNPRYRSKKSILMYHADYVKPSWDYSKLKKFVTEGKHIFYEMKRKATK